MFLNKYAMDMQEKVLVLKNMSILQWGKNYRILFFFSPVASIFLKWISKGKEKNSLNFLLIYFGYLAVHDFICKRKQ